MYLQKAYIQIEKAFLEESGNNVAAMAGKLLGGKSSTGKPQTSTYQFTVPFNPSELHISSQGGTVRKKADIQNSNKNNPGDTYVYESVKPRRRLRVKLIFDEKENSLTGVTRKVEGFLAAVRSPATRSIFFGWNQIEFSGSLENVTATYTIFSPQGIPLRSEVTLNITGK